MLTRALTRAKKGRCEARYRSFLPKKEVLRRKAKGGGSVTEVVMGEVDYKDTAHL